MLFLDRREGDKLDLTIGGETVTISVESVRYSVRKVRLGIVAPQSVQVCRHEALNKTRKERKPVRD